MQNSIILSIKEVSQVYSGIKNTYTDKVALRNVNFDIALKQFSSVIGKSGCGKTTLFRIIAGLLSPTTGAVYLNEELISSPHKDIAVVFQDYSRSLVMHRTVSENVHLGLVSLKLDKTESRERIKYYLQVVGLLEAANNYPWELSGGMQQRVVIARALIRQPKLLLLDEPFGSLDAPTRFELEDQLLQLVKRFGITVFMITHDIDEAIYMSDRILIMNQNGILNGANKGVFSESDLLIDLGTERNQVITRGAPEFSKIRGLIFEKMRLGFESSSQAIPI